jgi:hypothetical protein
MTFKEWLTRLRALFSSMPPDSDDTGEIAAEQPDATEDEASLRTEVDRLRARARMADAVTFADTEIHARRAYPAEREPLIASFLQAAEDDERLPSPATFGSDAPVSRVGSLRALLAARMPHALTEELLDPSKPARALFHEQKTGAQAQGAEVRRAELLSQTRLGRDILKMEKGK